jgi:hypothetical protein
MSLVSNLAITKHSAFWHSRSPFLEATTIDRMICAAYPASMPNRSSNPKRPRDVNQLAKAIVDQATGERSTGDSVGTGQNRGANEKDAAKAAAAMLGRLGGLKGGKARAAKLSKKRRSEIAKKAASKRWSKRPPK